MRRISKNEYYLNIAREVAARGTCLRRNYGAVIVKNDQIISTGYTGAPRGTPNCCDIGHCKRQELNVPPGERYELCRSVHSEMNAIIHAARENIIGATLYLVGVDTETRELVNSPRPCKLCARVLINAGIDKIITWKKKEMCNIDFDDPAYVPNFDDYEIEFTPIEALEID